MEDIGILSETHELEPIDGVLALLTFWTWQVGSWQ